MAEGYARSRPPVHPRVLDLVRRELCVPAKFARALDVGCGAGLSTRAMQDIASWCVGLEPAVRMVSRAPQIAAGAGFVAGTAEKLPFADACFDLIAAAGSLNYVQPERFFDEADRVLTEDGIVVVYDFAPGRTFPENGSLDEWFHAFITRYPPPDNEARSLSPEVLAGIDPRFQVLTGQTFAIPIMLTRESYVDYMMTETNVAAAIRRGVAPEEIRAWCVQTLEPVWRGRPCTVLFPGYYACLSRQPSSSSMRFSSTTSGE